MPHRVLSFCWLLACATLPLCVATTSATVRFETSLPDLIRPAAHVIRGRCTSATEGRVVLGGAALRATSYTFEVLEYLKGSGPATFTFRQIGSRVPLAHDLGRLAGLPVYAPGDEYVLFLLPNSTAGLTSPSGAGAGALRVDGDVAIPMTGAISGIGPTTATHGLGGIRREALRAAVKAVER
jgi:hypothetical protein